MLKLSESLRKSIHISSLLIPLGYRYVLQYERRLMFLLLLAAFVLMLIVEFHRFWQKGFRKTFWKILGLVLRRHELKDFTGATYLLFSGMLCVAFFPAHIAFFAMSFLSLGDTFAALVGINLGKRKFKRVNKSLEGSLACFLVCLIYGLALAADPRPEFTLHPLLAFTGALAATGAELSWLPLDDNLKMPLISALAMALTSIFI